MIRIPFTPVQDAWPPGWQTYEVGEEFPCQNMGDSPIRLQPPPGVVMRSSGGRRVIQSGGMVIFRKITENKWLVIGDLQ